MPLVFKRLFQCACAPVIGIAAAACFSHSVHAGTLYYADIFFPDASYGSIRKSDSMGRNIDVILETGGDLRAFDIDPVAAKIYWVQAGFPSIIARANLDGSDVQTLISSDTLPQLQFPSAIAVDPQGGKMYWGDQVTNGLWRANLDGSSPQLLRNTAFHRGIALDLTNGKVYWSTSETFLKGEILRCNLNGSTLETVVTSFDPEFKPSAIALDIPNGKVYWSDYVVDVVRWSNLDGTGIQTLYFVGANLNPRGVAIDHKAGKVYWGQDIDFRSPIGAVMRMNLDGSLPETFIPFTGLANYLVVFEGEDTKPPCPGDIAPANGDGAVNVDDLVALLAAWGPNPGSPADLNGDEQVNVDDLVTLLAAWGPCQR